MLGGSAPERLGAPWAGSARLRAAVGGAAVGGATGDVDWPVGAAGAAVPLGAPASSGEATVPVTARPAGATMAARATAQMPSFDLDVLRFGGKCAGRRLPGPGHRSNSLVRAGITETVYRRVSPAIKPAGAN